MSIETMKMALEALEEINKLSIGENAICLPAEIDTAMDALRQAIEQAEQAQPLTEKRILELYSFWVVDCQDIVGFARAVERSKPQTQQEGTVMAEYKFQTYAAYKKDGEMKIGVVPEPEQEPMAWHDPEVMNEDRGISWTHGQFHTAPLYAAPPERKWVGLTEAERVDIIDIEITEPNDDHWALAQSIEAMLKEKNT